MGQKANTTILQISTRKTESAQKYAPINIEDSSTAIYKSNKLLSYLTRIFEIKNYWVNQIKLTNSKKRLNIFLSFYKYKADPKSTKDLCVIKKLINQNLLISLNLYETNKTISFKTQNLNKKLSTKIAASNLYKNELKNTLIKLKPFFKNQSFQKSIHSLIIVITNPCSSALLNKLIANYLTENKKQHNFFLSFIKKALSILIKTRLSKIKGIKIVINGRLNGRPRARKTLIKIGTIPQQSMVTSIDYNESTAYTKNGTFGIKSWIAGS
jgi:hypothetical protein